MGETVRVEIDAHSIDRLGRVLARELRAGAADAAALDAARTTLPADVRQLERNGGPLERAFGYLDEAARLRWAPQPASAGVPKGWKPLYVRD